MDDSVRDSERDGAVSHSDYSQISKRQSDHPRDVRSARQFDLQIEDEHGQIKEVPDKRHLPPTDFKNHSKDNLVSEDMDGYGKSLDTKKESAVAKDQQDDDEEDREIVLPIEVEEIDVQEAIDALAYQRSKTKAEQSIIALDEKVNYIELMAFIENTHPTQEVVTDQMGSIRGDDKPPELPFKWFGFCDNIGTLCPGMPCCMKDKTSDMAKQLGVGPTLFLMSTKAFSWFFLALTILNIPIIMFFGSGNAAGEFRQLPDLFAILSLGNVGQSDYSCGTVNMEELYEKDPKIFGYSSSEQIDDYERVSQFNLNCGYGSTISGLVYIGIGKNESATCKEILQEPPKYKQWFQKDCYYQNSSYNTMFEYTDIATANTKLNDILAKNQFKTSGDERQLKKEQECMKLVNKSSPIDFYNTWFKCYCVGQSHCSVPVMTESDQTFKWDPYTSNSNDVQQKKFIMFDRYNWLNYKVKSQCYNNLQQSAEQGKSKGTQMILMASCLSPQIQNPFNKEQYWEKSQFGILVVFFDMGSVILIIVFAELLNKSQEDYAKKFDQQTVEMTDFTIRVKNLPHHEKYFDKDDVLRAVITHHFQEIVKDEMKFVKEQAELLGDQNDGERDFDNLTDIDPVRNFKEVEPLDFEVADVNFGKGNMKEMEYLVKLSTLQQQQTRNYIKKSNGNELNDQEAKKIEIEENKLNDEFIKIRDIYVQYQKEKLAALENEDVKVGGDPEVRYAYVTFRSQNAVSLVKQSYKRYGSCQRCCIMNCCCKGCCIKEREELKKKHIFKKWPMITEACNPDNINWQNLGYGNGYRTFMKILNWLIAIIMICVSLFFVILLKQEVTKLKEEYKIDVVCPQRSGSEEFKSIAWNDQQLKMNERLGLMHCFCFKKLLSTGTKVRSIKFEEFMRLNKTSGNYVKDTKEYCDEWFFNYGFQQSAVIGTSLVVVVINIIASTVLTLTIGLEKNHTVNDETMGQFQKLTILQFINIAVIILIINFNITKDDVNIEISDVNDDFQEPISTGLWLGFLPIFNGDYEDFTSEWFSQVGKTLTLTLLINIFTPHISKISLPFLKLLKRCCDRRCSCQVWKKKQNKNDIDVNTKLLIQSDLNDLYTGDQIQSHYVYAQNYTYLCVVLMYSTGLPILYPFAAVFYCILYWVYKSLMLKYYARTTKFNQEIPIESMSWVKFGIFAHLLIGGLMLSNQDFFPSMDWDDEDHTHDELSWIPYDGFFIVDYFHRMHIGTQSSIYFAFVVIVFLIWVSKFIINLLLNFCGCAKKPISKMINCMLKIFTLCCKSKVKEIDSNDIYREYNVQSLENAYKKAKEDLDDFKNNMDRGNSVSYKEHRFPEEVNFESTTIIETHSRRIQQIENVIDSHLIHLHGKWNLHKFDHLTVPQKLFYLLPKQQLVDKETRMRMVDITQSYNILDSQMFKSTKLVQDKIEENENYNLLGAKK